MIFDKTQMAADDLAHDGTVTEIDLGNPEAGRGEPITINFQGHSLTTATSISVDIKTSATSGSGHASDQLIAGLSAAEANKGLSLTLPANAGVKRYLLMVLTGTTGGTFTCGIVMGGAQNNP